MRKVNKIQTHINIEKIQNNRRRSIQKKEKAKAITCRSKKLPNNIQIPNKTKTQNSQLSTNLQLFIFFYSSNQNHCHKKRRFRELRTLHALVTKKKKTHHFLHNFNRTDQNSGECKIGELSENPKWSNNTSFPSHKQFISLSTKMLFAFSLRKMNWKQFVTSNSQNPLKNSTHTLLKPQRYMITPATGPSGRCTYVHRI